MEVKRCFHWNRFTIITRIVQSIAQNMIKQVHSMEDTRLISQRTKAPWGLKKPVRLRSIAWVGLCGALSAIFCGVLGRFAHIGPSFGAFYCVLSLNCRFYFAWSVDNPTQTGLKQVATADSIFLATCGRPLGVGGTTPRLVTRHPLPLPSWPSLRLHTAFPACHLTVK